MKKKKNVLSGREVLKRMQKEKSNAYEKLFKKWQQITENNNKRKNNLENKAERNINENNAAKKARKMVIQREERKLRSD